MCVAKAKALISHAVTARLICAFVFAHADCWFSGAAAQIADVHLAQKYLEFVVSLCLGKKTYNSKLLFIQQSYKHIFCMLFCV